MDGGKTAPGASCAIWWGSPRAQNGSEVGPDGSSTRTRTSTRQKCQNSQPVANSSFRTEAFWWVFVGALFRNAKTMATQPWLKRPPTPPELVNGAEPFPHQEPLCPNNRVGKLFISNYSG